MICRKLALSLLVVLFSSVMVTAQDVSKNGQPEAKKLSGMSIVGNDEAPKSLYIVPWKSPQIGAETSLDTVFSESGAPLDRDVLKRQLEFYKASTRK